jgi:hypothetical protein
MPAFADREVVAWLAQRIPTAVNLDLVDRSRYFFIEMAPQLSSRGWVGPVPNPLVVLGIELGISGSVVRNS